MGNLENFKYKTIPNFLTKEEALLLKEYCILRHINNKDSFDLAIENADTGFYKDFVMQSLLINKKKLVEKIIELELNETYSYWRCYTWGSDLKEHIDRKSCEISVSVFIGSDGTDWPLYMENKPINLNVGDAVVYKGCNVRHGRKEFKGDYHIQTFLHYVDKNGKYAEHKGDSKNEMLERKDMK